MAVSAETKEAADGRSRSYIITLEGWKSKTPRERLDLRDSTKELIIEDPEHGFPWTLERRYTPLELLQLETDLSLQGSLVELLLQRIALLARPLATAIHHATEIIPHPIHR